MTPRSTRADIRDVEGLQPLEALPPLRHRVYDRLEELIVTGALVPGARLVEGDLAQTLGVSRGPIREALQLLARDGFIDLRPRQGAFVHVPTEKEVEDFFDVRRALEIESARLAAKKITPEVAERLQTALSFALELLDSGTDPSTVHEQVDFHGEITRAAQNPLLEQMLRGLERSSRWYLSPFEPEMRRRAWGEHAEILAKIVAGDIDGAMAAIAAHIDAAASSTKERFSGGAGAPPSAVGTALGIS